MLNWYRGLRQKVNQFIESTLGLEQKIRFVYGLRGVSKWAPELAFNTIRYLLTKLDDSASLEENIRKLPPIILGNEPSIEKQVEWLYNNRHLIPDPELAYGVIKEMIPPYEKGDGWRRYRDEFLEHFPEALNAMAIPVSYSEGITYSSENGGLDEFVFLAATHEKINGIPILELLTDLFSDPDSTINPDTLEILEIRTKIRETLGNKITSLGGRETFDPDSLQFIPSGVQDRAEIMGRFLGLQDLAYKSLPDQLRFYDQRAKNDFLDISTAVYLVEGRAYMRSSDRDFRKEIERPWNQFMTALGDEFGKVTGIMDPNYVNKSKGDITPDGELELYRPENGELVDITKREISLVPALADLLGRSIQDLREELEPYIPFMADEVGVLYSDMFLARGTGGIIPFTSIVPGSNYPSVAVNSIKLDGETYAVMTARFTRGGQQGRFQGLLDEVYGTAVNMDHWSKLNYLNSDI